MTQPKTPSPQDSPKPEDGSGKTAAPSDLAPGPKPPPRAPTAELLEALKTELLKNNAQNIIELDLTAHPSLADTMLVLSATSNRHAHTLAEKTLKLLKSHNHKPKTDGLSTANWIAIDAGAVVIHIFLPEVREYYKIEDIWTAPTHHK